MKDFTCKIKVRPVSDWVKDGEGCPPCAIAPLASHYVGVLEAAGETSHANSLKQAYEEGELLTICQELDRIKSVVGESLRAELEDMDCFAQSEKF